MTNNVSTLPEPGVILDLDSLERPAEDVPEPFKVKVGGKLITFKDPAEIEWQDLAAVSIPSDIFSVSLSREDRKHIRETPMQSWQFNALMKAYYDHYGLEDKIRDARRQQALTQI